MSDDLTWEFEPPGPVSDAFMCSDAFIRGIRGPVGSGKTTDCIMDMLRTGTMQPRDKDGRRKYRGVITRNTYGELESTTIKSFHMWIPPTVGRYVQKAPIEHSFQLGEVDYEFLFLALDRPDHVKKLLSLEVTQGWLNEAREIPKAILDALTARVGRYPSMKMGNDEEGYGSRRSGVIMDTNSPDSDHWWAKMSDFQDEEGQQQVRELEQQLRDMNALPEGQKLMEFFTQPPGETADGKQNPEAENLENLPPGYYVKIKIGKGDEWIKVYVRNEYGFVMDGKAVYDTYRDNMHAVPLQYNPAWPLHIGMDFGLTPAAVFAQQTPMGRVNVLSELIATRLGAKNFAREVKTHLQMNYPNCRLGTVTGDPAGDAGNPNDEESTVFKMLASEGLIALPASTNVFSIRREAVSTPLSQLIDGLPRLLINAACRGLRKAMAGGYHFRRVKISSDERYTDVPDKNMHSHVAEALQYLMIGLGIGKEVIREPESRTASRRNRPATATTMDG